MLRRVPLRSLLLSLVSLAAPVLAVWAFRDGAPEGQGWLIGLAFLVPAFVLAYYRGLRGAALAVAGGMAVLAITQVVVVLLGPAGPSRALLLALGSVYLGVCVVIAVFAEVLRRERRAAERLALVDTLTGLPNRRHAEIMLDAHFGAATRGRRLVVVLFDLDGLERVNDRHGHGAGDAALCAFADVLKRSTRRMNLSARFDGAEFISVLTDLELDEALRFANRVREAIQAHAFAWGRVTVSAGVAEYQDGMGTHEVLVAAADRALYAAKQAGGDRVEAAHRRSVAVPAPVQATATDVEPPRSKGGETVVVVDDDPDVLRSVGRLLKQAGYGVQASADPEAVLGRLRDGAFTVDLLVTDIVMPKMSGLTLADCAGVSRPELPVVYMSGYLQREVSWTGLPGAGVGFVTKPIDPAKLLATVRLVLDRRPPPK
ncbi:MAG: diguanylate cyclase [Gemmatimonadetes bacterium]|nr:diguanylate cyclase [Gemmatimonadota bacterium]